MKMLRRKRFIAVLNRIPMKQTASLVKALYDGGVRLFEFRFNPDDPDTAIHTAKAISMVKDTYGKSVSVGAGNVTSPDDATTACKAGAAYIFSPYIDVKIEKCVHELGRIWIPSADFTLDIIKAYEYKADAVRVFPTKPEEVYYFQHCIAQLSKIPLIPTGHMLPTMLQRYYSFGALATALGKDLFPDDALNRKDYEYITKLAETYVKASAKRR